MKFSQYIEGKEAAETQEINQIFNQAATDIQGLFDQLYKGTADMVRNYEKAALPEELQAQILKDLQRIAAKVKGKKAAPAVENVTINAFINDIMDLINEANPSIVQDLGSHGVGPGGKKAYDFRSTITNVYNMVMQRMGQLKDAVFQHMGLIRDTHKRLGGVRNTVGGIRNRLGDISNQLSNPQQPLSAGEADKAQDSMIAISDAANQLGGLWLQAQDGTKIPVNPQSAMWKKHVLKHGQQHKIFTLLTKDGRQEQINIGDPASIHNVLDTLGFKSTSDFVPKPKRRLPAKKLVEPKPKPE